MGSGFSDNGRHEGREARQPALRISCRISKSSVSMGEKPSNGKTATTSAAPDPEEGQPLGPASWTGCAARLILQQNLVSLIWTVPLCR